MYLHLDNCILTEVNLMLSFLHSENFQHVHLLGGIQNMAFCIHQIYLKLYIEVDMHLIKQIAHITSKESTNLSRDNLMLYKAVLLCLAFQYQLQRWI